MLRELLRLKTGDASTNWTRASREVREAAADMTGKDASGNALRGHRHTEFLAWCEDDQPTRLLVWRGARAFDADEQEAILLAAARDVSWAAAGSNSDEWKIRLVPLDRAVPPPPGFDRRSSMVWESVTPYVPPRHHLRGGKERPAESLESQIRRELTNRGVLGHVDVEMAGSPVWVSVHVPRRDANRRAAIGDRQGRVVRLRFSAPVSGPIRLGHSSSFGLGLFRPVVSPQNGEYGLESRNSGMAQASTGSSESPETGAQRRANLAEHDVRARTGGLGLAEGSTRPPETTRGFDTSLGRLSYDELFRQLAEPLSYIGRRIRADVYADQPLDQHLLLQFHSELTGALFPDQAGKYRSKDVHVSAHQPPAWHQVPSLIVDYVRNLNARLEGLPPEPDDHWLEALAYAEGELLSIHPFPDFNGRVCRLWMTETLRRIGLPTVDIAPTDPAFRERFLAALASADRRDWQPLMVLWKERLESPGEQP